MVEHRLRNTQRTGRGDIPRGQDDDPDLPGEAVILRFSHELCQSDIGAVLGCSQMRVSRLLRQALRRMWERLRP